MSNSVGRLEVEDGEEDENDAADDDVVVVTVFTAVDIVEQVQGSINGWRRLFVCFCCNCCCLGGRNFTSSDFVELFRLKKILFFFFRPVSSFLFLFFIDFCSLLIKFKTCGISWPFLLLGLDRESHSHAINEPDAGRVTLSLQSTVM